MKKDNQQKNKKTQKNSNTKDKDNDQNSRSRNVTPRAKSSTVKSLVSTMNTKKEAKENIISKEVKVGSRANLLEKRAFSKESQRSQTLAQHNELVNKK